MKKEGTLNSEKGAKKKKADTRKLGVTHEGCGGRKMKRRGQRTTTSNCAEVRDIWGGGEGVNFAIYFKSVRKRDASSEKIKRGVGVV